MRLTAPGREDLDLTVTRVMGVLNVTPDSFSDGGRYAEPEAAAAQAGRMIEQGAAIIDVGGESTRPGAARIGEAEQLRRVIPVIERLAAQHPRVWISIDTTHSGVARAALDAGACMLNDVAAGREDSRLLALAAERRVPIVLMHMQGNPATMQDDPHYDDVVAEVAAFLAERAATTVAAGVPASQVVVDPGIGFGKTTEHNLQLLANLPRIVALGHPVLLGVSRKRFIAPDLPPEQRLGGTVAATILAARAGVALIRVHDVRPNAQALELVRRMGS